MALNQIRAASPARGYTRRYGSDSGSWTTSNFVDAVYQTWTSRERESPVRRSGSRHHLVRNAGAHTRAESRRSAAGRPKHRRPVDLSGYWVAVVNEDWAIAW